MADPDDFFTPDAARALEAKLRGLGKDVTITVHPAGHGFMNEDNPIGTHDAALAQQLWPDVTGLLHQQLRCPRSVALRPAPPGSEAEQVGDQLPDLAERDGADV